MPFKKIKLYFINQIIIIKMGKEMIVFKLERPNKSVPWGFRLGRYIPQRWAFATKLHVFCH